ncbi:MAG: DUF3168 domain-containing protein [Tepidisphaeraceae bacterium]
MIETGFQPWAIAQAGITAIIGDRLYPAGEVPQNPTFPYATFQRISTREFDDISGAGLTQRVRFQIDCYARSHLGSLQLANEFRKALSGFRGDMGAFANVKARRLDQLHDFEPPASAQEKGEFRTIEQFYVFYDEAA